MTNKEKALILGVIDEILVDQFNQYEHFTEEERDRVSKYYEETMDTSAPREIRESLVALARKLYTEVFVDER